MYGNGTGRGIKGAASCEHTKWPVLVKQMAFGVASVPAISQGPMDTMLIANVPCFLHHIVFIGGNIVEHPHLLEPVF